MFHEFRSLETREESFGSVDDLLLSFTHMWINRTTPHYGADAALYDLLHRQYLSERARATSSGPKLVESAAEAK